MKRFFSNTINRTGFLLLIVAAVLLQVACKKEHISGPPVINSVSLLDSTKRDSSITTAFPGTYVVINGQGFTGLQEIYVNDTLINFNSAIQSDTKIVVAIPASVPTEATNPNVSNQIRLVTDHGETTFAFTLVPPPPSILSISNEMALPGSTIVITGSNFYGIQKVVFAGGLEETAFTVDPTATTLTVKVPDALTEAGPIQIFSKYGTGSNPLIIFNGEKQSGMLATFDYEGTPYFGWAYWGGIKTNDATLFPGNRGNYIEIKPTSSINQGDNAWYTDNRAVNLNVTSKVLLADSILNSPSENITNYALKFELFTKAPWTVGTLLVRIGGDAGPYRLRFAPWKTASENTFQTNGWQTVSIPLTEFKTYGNGMEGGGTSATSLSQLFATNDGTMQIGLVNESATPVTQFDAAIDNVRIVKVK